MPWIIVLLCTLFSGVSMAQTAPRPVVAIQPLGRALPAAEVERVRQALSAVLAVDTVVLDRVELPREAYYAPRKRYRAERLLTFLQARKPDTAHRILGLTAVDISTTKGAVHDWGILGLANLDGTACVISHFRAKRGADSRVHASERLAKVAVHEIGHTLGLDHCPTVGCLMEDARGKVATTDREYQLCHRCQTELKVRGHVCPESPTPPWSKPRSMTSVLP